MATLANIQAEYKLALQDAASTIEINSNTDVRDSSIKDALLRYGRRLPYLKTVLVSATASPYYAVPSGWVDGVSRVVSIEYPINSDPPEYLAPKSWRIVRRESSQVLYVIPNPGGSFRLTFVTKHDETAPTTIPVEHEGLLGRWAAAIAALTFAAKYANSVSNNVDAVNYRTKEQEWRAVEKALREAVDNDLRRAEVAFQFDADPFVYYRGWN